MTTFKTMSTAAIATVLATGIAFADPAMDYKEKPQDVSFTAEEIKMAEQVVGQPIMFGDGTVFGTITMVDTNGINEPQFHVEVTDSGSFGADKVIISVAREALSFDEGAVTIKTSEAEMKTQAERDRSREVIYIDVNA